MTTTPAVTLQLPTTPEQLIDSAIAPALHRLPTQMTTRTAVVGLVTIALQETNLEHRWQVTDPKRPEHKGPARSLWQFERPTCGLVIRHAASRYWVHDLCAWRGIHLVDSLSLWTAMESDDVLAAGVARLLMFTDAQRLPTAEDPMGWWQLYVRVWRPGAVRRDPEGLMRKFFVNHARAIAAVLNH